MRKTDGTNINPNYLAYRWMVEVRGVESIKGEEKEQCRGSEMREKKHCSNPQPNL